MNGVEPAAVAFCPECGRECHLTTRGELITHTPPDDPYGPACPRTLPALPHRKPRRNW